MPIFERIHAMLGDTLFHYAFVPVFKISLILGAVLGLVTYIVLVERRFLGFIQVRRGPNRVGWFGLLQPFADTLKLISKEDVIPNKAIKWAFLLSPILVVAPAFLLFAVVPFGPRGEDALSSWFLADLNVGLLFLVSVATLGVYGILLGGWASNSKYSLMGGLRSAAQMISYEVPQGLAVVVPILMAGTLSLVGVVEAQLTMGRWFIFAFFPFGLIAFYIYLVTGVAETNRNPFDLPEAESELVAGFHTEYSGMRFALFFMGEYANMIVISAVATTLFLGGWSRPFPNVEFFAFFKILPPVIWFFIKVFSFMVLFIWVRGTFPRYRFDQLMNLGWKWLLPLSLFTIFAVALWKVLGG